MWVNRRVLGLILTSCSLFTWSPFNLFSFLRPQISEKALSTIFTRFLWLICLYIANFSVTIQSVRNILTLRFCNWIAYPWEKRMRFSQNLAWLSWPSAQERQLQGQGWSRSELVETWVDPSSFLSCPSFFSCYRVRYSGLSSRPCGALHLGLGKPWRSGTSIEHEAQTGDIPISNFIGGEQRPPQ